MDIKNKFDSLTAKVVLLFALLAAFTFLINRSWFDEEFHPGLSGLASPDFVSLDGNAFPMTHGFAASSKIDFAAAGRAIIGALRERHEQGEMIALSEAEMERFLGVPNLDDTWRAGFQSLDCNSRLSLDCADRLASDIERYDLTEPRLRLLLERFEKILQAPRFEENQEADENTPLPSYGLLMQVSRIRLAISYQRDSTDEFLNVVAEDMKFWRMVLRDGQSLIAKMVALAGFRNDLDFVSALIRGHDLDDREILAVRNVLRPFTNDELDIGESFLAELRISALSPGGLFAFLRSSSGLARVFSQERATLNEYYLTTVLPLQSRASLDAESFYHQRGYERLSYSVPIFPPPLYNLGGKLALKRIAAVNSAQDYISRMHDVNGRVTLVLLQAEIEETPGKDVDAVVNSSIHKNPYSGEPMVYDASLQTLAFECLPSNSTDVCGVAIGSLSN